MSDVAIHANSGDDVGLGHLVRCGTLAKELISRNVTVGFHLKPDADAEAFVKRSDIQPNVVDSPNIVQDLRQSSSNVLVVDSYEFSTNDFENLGAERELVVIDELGNRRIPADLVINNNVYADDIAYPDADWVLRGPEYCMLRQDFLDLPEPNYDELPDRILLTVGGSDLAGAFMDILKITADVVPHFTTIDTVVGPYFEDIPNAFASIEVHENPRNIHELMWRADAAVSGGGQTLYELAATGTPPVAVALGTDQTRNINGFEKAGFCLNAGTPDEPNFEDRFRTQLSRLLSELDRRRRMGKEGRSLVDGEGAVRIADAVMSLC